MQTADWMQTIVFRVRKQWDYQWLHSLVAPVFFSGFLRNCINRVYNCEDHSSFDFIPAVLIYDLFFISYAFVNGTIVVTFHLHGENNVLHWEQSPVFILYLCYIMGHTLCHSIKTVKFKWNGISETSLTYMDKLLAFHTKSKTFCLPRLGANMLVVLTVSFGRYTE